LTVNGFGARALSPAEGRARAGGYFSSEETVLPAAPTAPCTVLTGSGTVTDGVVLAGGAGVEGAEVGGGWGAGGTAARCSGATEAGAGEAGGAGRGAGRGAHVRDTGDASGVAVTLARPGSSARRHAGAPSRARRAPEPRRASAAVAVEVAGSTTRAACAGAAAWPATGAAESMSCGEGRAEPPAGGPAVEGDQSR